MKSRPALFNKAYVLGLSAFALASPLLGQAGTGYNLTTPDGLAQFVEDGTPLFNARLRWEQAEAGTAQQSDAVTVRTRLGFQTASLYGFQALVELEDVLLMSDEDEVNLAGQNPLTAGTHTAIADPEETEINRVWLAYTAHETTLKGGRERIILDNARFIGNVGWRQNEQTFDSISLSSKAIESLSFTYAYVWKVQRIFGDDAPGGADFEADVHLINVNWAAADWLSLTGFGYLQELETATGAAFSGSNDTYGVRATGSKAIADTPWKLACDASWATQSENDGSPTGSAFDLDYFAADLKVHYDKFWLGAGFEILEGNGARQFTTPLATVHAFQGWADTFLGASIGGTALGGGGIEDTYISGGAKLPVGDEAITLKALYHWFETDTSASGGFDADYGTELDLVAVYPVHKHVTLLAKFADYDASSDAGNPTADVRRFWLEVTVKY